MPNINKFFSHNFIEYASYVIKDRAIPDADDGFKPVQRRILHSLQEMDDGKFNKVANIVGNTMKYHPHGDASIYSSLVVLANKEYFIEKQGNFGNIFTGDEASAARYIECRLSSLAKEVLYNKDLTEYTSSYDGRNKEPLHFPAKIPVLLLLGTEGIAVGMSTKILPHNFNELLEAQIKILKKEDFDIYPDFLQHGTIDVTDYNEGNGRVRVRARIDETDEKTLLIREIPFGTTTESIIDSIEKAAKSSKIKISSINDYTAEEVEIEIKTARGEYSSNLKKLLYAYTDCEMSISVNLICIVNSEPRELSVKDLLKYNTMQLKDTLKRELEIEQEKLSERLQDLTLEQIFIENRIYKQIEELETYDEIITTVTDAMNKFKELFIRELTLDDVERLLEIKIKRISRYDMNKNRRTIDDIVRNLNEVKRHLKNVTKYTIDYISGLIKKYGKDYPRKTKITNIESIDKSDIKLPDVKVGWDKESGFFGKDVKSETIFTVSPLTKFIVFDRRGFFKVISIEDKTFIDVNVLYLDVIDEKRIYTVIYKDLSLQTSYVKRFQFSKYILNKEYKLAPAKEFQVQYFSIRQNPVVTVHYEKKPRQKVNSEVQDLSKIQVKAYNIKGNRVSTKTVKRVVKK